MRGAALSVLLLCTLTTIPAIASPPANTCDRTMENVDNAKAIVIAKPKAIATSTKDSAFTVRVTYDVEQALVGAKTAEVVVEETCDTGSATAQESGYPSVAKYCTSGMHSLPGLTADGSIGPSAAALTLVEDKSAVDGKPVMKVVRGSAWSPCPDERRLLEKRPALKDLVAKVQAANAKTTSGFPAPKTTPAASSASASASASAAPPSASASAIPASTSSSAPPPATSSAAPPAKSGGCSSCSVTGVASSGVASAWPLVALVAVALRRRRRVRA